MPVRRIQQLPVPRARHAAVLGLMGERLRVETNDPRILDAATASFGRFPVPDDDGRAPLLLRLFVEAAPGRPIAEAGSPPSPPGAGIDSSPGPSVPGPDAGLVFRSAGTALVITRGAEDVATVDVVAGLATGFVGGATAADPPVLRYTFLETMALSMLVRGRGYLAIHAAAVVRGGAGLVLHGPSGAGKSTLAMACARRGFAVLAEDAVFVRPEHGEAVAWGMPWRQRLLPDATDLFPELRGLEVRPQPNGERKLEVDLDALLPGQAVTRAPLGAIVHVARATHGPTRLERLDADRDDPAGFGAIELPWPHDGGWGPEHDAAVAAIQAVPAYRLHVNGTPDDAVEMLQGCLGVGR